MIHIIGINEKKRWNKYVEASLEAVFCQTNDYHSLENDKEPFLFVYEKDWGFIAIPFLKRPIPDTNYYDLSSVYGYGGPMSNKHIHSLEAEHLELFQKSFLCFLHENNFVSVFLRLNPFTKQNRLFEKIGGLYPNGKSVVIDLSLSSEERRKQYRENVKCSIRRCRQKGYKIREEVSKKGIKQFTNIYNETMHRKKASDFYFFSEEYVSKLLYSPDFETKIYIAYDGDKPICGTLVIFYEGIVHAHLIGTTIDYLKDSPAKLMVDTLCDIGKEKGMKFYHLGGGIGFKEDTLFEWKKGFSQYFLDYYSWRFVSEKNIYLKLVEKQGIDPNSQIDFFPLYRYQLIG